MIEISKYINNDDIDNVSGINKYNNVNVIIFDENVLK